MGTVRGDLHDIGKNLVCMMAEGAGFEVHDIGVDQSVEKFMAAADKCNPTIIGMSALLTTTMTYMKTVIDGFEAAGPGRHQVRGRRRADQPDVRRRDRRRRLRPERVGRGRPVPATRRRRSRRRRAGGRSPLQPAAGNGAGAAREARRSTYKVLYWQEIPSQIKAEDDAGNEVSVELPPKFAEHIDDVAAQARLPERRRVPRPVEVERRSRSATAPRDEVADGGEGGTGSARRTGN